MDLAGFQTLFGNRIARQTLFARSALVYRSATCSVIEIGKPIDLVVARRPLNIPAWRGRLILACKPAICDFGLASECARILEARQARTVKVRSSRSAKEVPRF